MNPAMLTDVVVVHAYQGRKTAAHATFTLHPFAIRQGPHAGRYEILHSRRGTGNDPRHTGHVTQEQLAELYARGLPERLGIRLRLKPAEGIVYPDTLPAKKVPAAAIVPGSGFARQVAAVDTAAPLSAPLRTILQDMGLAAA